MPWKTNGRGDLRAFLLYAASLIASPAVCVAQTVGDATGVIDGTMTDHSGGVLAGVVVRVTGPASMNARDDVSRRDGYYRLPALPPGEYVLTFTHADFQAATRTGIRVDAGSTTSLPVTLDVARREEVNVSSESRLVDPHGTTIVAVTNARQLDLLPGARTPGAILSIAPAVQFNGLDVGGHTAPGTRPFSAYGIAGFNEPTIEGISISQHNRYGFSLDYGSFEEVSVGLGAYGPEWPTPGLHMRVITKSGGNQYRGSVFAAYADRRWQAHNIDDGQIARGAAGAPGLSPRDVNRLSRSYDVNADVGGYLRRDRAWWYGSARDQRVETRLVTFPVSPVATRATSVTMKSTVRIRTGHLVLFASLSRAENPTHLGAFLRPAAAVHLSSASTAHQTAEGIVGKAEWNAAVGGRLFVEARIGRFAARRDERPNSGAPRFEDLVEFAVSGGNRAWYERLQRDQLTGSVSHFADGRLGRHHLRAGAELDRTVANEVWQASYGGDVLHVLRSGIPAEVYLFHTPSRSEAGQWWPTLFVHDSWQMNQRLTLNAGARYDHFRVFLPEQSHPVGRFNPTPQTFAAVNSVIDWNVVAPRVGASVDLLGDGRTLLKGSYGLYWLPPSTELAFNANPNARVWWELFAWSDDNSDGVWQAGEQAAEPLDRRGGGAIELVDPHLEPAYVRELTGRFEREIGARVSVTTGVVWRGERRQGLRQLSNAQFDQFTVPVTFFDPGVSGTTLLASGEGPGIALYDLPPDLVGPPELVVRNVPRSSSDYLTWDFTAARRLSGRWSLNASAAFTWNRDHENAYVGQTVRANEYPVTPNDLINTDAEGRHAFHVWSAKLHGTWEGPWGLRLTPLLRHQSGQPFGRTALARLRYGAIRLLVEPIGTRRQDHVTLVDLGVQKDVRLPGGRRLSGVVEIFNLFNANAEQNVSWASGSTFLRPLSVVPPRVARVGVKVNW